MKTKLFFFSIFLLLNLCIQAGDLKTRNEIALKQQGFHSPFDAINLERVVAASEPVREIDSQLRDLIGEPDTNISGANGLKKLRRRLSLVCREHRLRFQAKERQRQLELVERELAECKSIRERFTRVQALLVRVEGSIRQKQEVANSLLSESERTVLQMRCHNASPKKRKQGFSALDRKYDNTQGLTQALLDKVVFLTDSKKNWLDRLDAVFDSSDGYRTKMRVLDDLEKEITQFLGDEA